MNISVDKSGSERRVEVSGSLTVADSLKFKKAVGENLRKGNKLELAFGDVTEMDISIIQIIAAAVRAAEPGDREFGLKTPVPEPVAQALKLSGFLNHYDCAKPDCVWCAVGKQLQGA